MSHTTDILITTGSLDEGKVHDFNECLAKFGFNASAGTPWLTAMHAARDNLPGTKYFTDGIWAACWNYGDKDQIVAAFKAFDWEQPENAVLIVAVEQHDTEVHRPEFY